LKKLKNFVLNLILFDLIFLVLVLGYMGIDNVLHDEKVVPAPLSYGSIASNNNVFTNPADSPIIQRIIQEAQNAPQVIVEEAEPDHLANLELRNVRVRFIEPVDADVLDQVEGVSLISKADGSSVNLQVEGEMDRLIKALAAYPVADLEIDHPSLEEIFLAYYETDEKEEV